MTNKEMKEGFEFHLEKLITAAYEQRHELVSEHAGQVMTRFIILWDEMVERAELKVVVSKVIADASGKKTH